MSPGSILLVWSIMLLLGIPGVILLGYSLFKKEYGMSIFGGVLVIASLFWFIISMSSEKGTLFHEDFKQSTRPTAEPMVVPSVSVSTDRKELDQTKEH